MKSKLGIGHALLAIVVALAIAYLTPIAARAGEDESQRIFH